ncbi:C6 zinc finger domain protein [Colletotrichum karsti]|uniref:C6 zinc finger domain protein n=1 Tax=Colletotrichum karsti TaxID=1095194 RepID=A0A9P6LH67_9PEZI|nr:C6 zinc finger domain protein [Colletotrichum karsti]KAF9872911.1 C6 zinc finger domain protein [Colletotrichum karsti]
MIFDANAVDILNPWTLMPNDLAKTLNQINTLRAQDTLEPSTKTRMEGLSAVLSLLEEATPDSWASEVATNANVWLSPGHLSEDPETKAAWKAMMMAFLNATVLYAVNSLAGLHGTPARLAAFSQGPRQYLVGRETAAYDALMSSIRLLFSQRVQRRCQEGHRPFESPATSAGLLHKFVIWPMVVGGIQAALVHHDDEGAGFLCSGMQSVGEELGTVSIIDGARLVEKLRQSQRNGLEPRSWDELFDGAPLFLM